MPMAAQSEISVLNVSSSAGVPLAQMMLSDRVVPFAMPAPQSVAPVPGDSQVSTPLTICQPRLVRSFLAAVRLNKYGLGTGSMALARPLTDWGVLGGSGLSMGTPYPLSTL